MFFAFIERKRERERNAVIVDITNKFIDYICNSQYQCNHNLNSYQLLRQYGKYWANSHRFDLSTTSFLFFFTNNHSGSRSVSFVNQFNRMTKIVNRVNQQKQETTKPKSKSIGYRV